MTPAALAQTHAACFTTPRPWTETEFAGFLKDPSVVFVGDSDGFAMARLAGPEAELLTIAVLPALRGQGIARELLGLIHTRAQNAGALEIFLEVAEDNIPAKHLYSGCGYTQAGIRQGYYHTPKGDKINALVLSKRFGTE